MGWARRVCAGSSPDVQHSDIGVVRGKGFPECGAFSPALGPQMLLFAKEIDPRTRLRQGWGQGSWGHP